MLPFILAATFLGQSPATATPATTTYHDPALHFTFDYPLAYKSTGLEGQVMEKARQDSSSPEVTKALTCVTNPLMAMNVVSGLSLVMIVRLDLECMKLPASSDLLPQLGNASLNQGLSRLGTPKLGEPTTYKLDGHDAVFIPGSAAKATSADGTDSSTVYGGISCALIEKSAVCWAAISQQRATVSTLLSSSVTFEGGTPHPVVPKTTLTQ